MMFNIVDVTQVQGGDLHPQHGVGLDGCGGAVAGGVASGWLGIRVVLA
jgi:hypothetical protein